jgi:hypothetical protein
MLKLAVHLVTTWHTVRNSKQNLCSEKKWWTVPRMQARKVVDATVRNRQISHLFCSARDHMPGTARLVRCLDRREASECRGLAVAQSLGGGQIVSLDVHRAAIQPGVQKYSYLSAETLNMARTAWPQTSVALKQRSFSSAIPVSGRGGL